MECYGKAFGDIPAVPGKVLIMQGEKVLYHSDHKIRSHE